LHGLANPADGATTPVTIDAMPTLLIVAASSFTLSL